MLKTILNLNGVTTIKSKELKSIIGGNGNETAESCEGQGMMVYCGRCIPRNTQYIEGTCP